MKWAPITRIFIVLMVAIIVIYDVATAVFGETHSSISGVIWDTSKTQPIVPFLMGVVMGHLFWQENKEI